MSSVPTELPPPDTAPMAMPEHRLVRPRRRSLRRLMRLLLRRARS